MKKIFLLMIMLITIFVTGCSFGHIEDTNGSDDYSICSFTEEEKIGRNHSVIKTGAVKSTLIDKMTYKVSKYSGIEDCFNITSGIYLFECQVESGNFEWFIIYNNEKIKQLPLNESLSYTVELANAKVRIIGESAKFEIKITKQ